MAAATPTRSSGGGTPGSPAGYTPSALLRSSSPAQAPAETADARKGREAGIQALIDQWYDAEYAPLVLHTLTRFFLAATGTDAGAIDAGVKAELEWVSGRTNRERFPVDRQEGVPAKASRAVAVLVPCLPSAQPQPTGLQVVHVVLESETPEQAADAQEQQTRPAPQAADALEQQTRPAPYLTLQRLRVLCTGVPPQPKGSAGPVPEQLALAPIPPHIPATALLTAVWRKLFEDCTRDQGLAEVPSLAPARAALNSAADAAQRRYVAEQRVVDAVNEVKRASLALTTAQVGAAQAAQKEAEQERERCRAGPSVEACIAAAARAVLPFDEANVQARAAEAARAAQDPGSRRVAPLKVLLRPLLALAATFESNPSEPFGPLKDNRDAEAEVREWNVYTLFCSALVPPGEAVLREFKPHFHGKWCEMLSRQSGLWSYLRYGSLESAKKPPSHTATASQQQRARVALLQAMEMQHQMFARCSLPELGELHTASQSFKATVEVETIALFPNDALWTWRDLLPEQRRRPELPEAQREEEFQLEEGEHVRELLPQNWSIQHDVHVAKHYESSACNWAVRTKFNKVLIGADKSHDSVTTSMPLKEEATGHLGGARRVLSFEGIETGLFLSRLVPEAAGDPWTEEGQKEIFRQYTKVRCVQTFSSTFECLLKLQHFPADQQQVVVDVSSEFLFFFSRFLHHQNAAFDCPTSAFHAWDPMGPKLIDRSLFEPKLSLPECQELHAMHAEVRALDFNSVWAVDERGHRKGDRLGVQWGETQVSSEFLEPISMDDEAHQVYLSAPSLNRTHSEYSHQRFTLTLMRKLEHYVLILLLPFFGLTSATGVAFGIPEGDYNSRLTILGSFFVASLALRYISVQYLPHVPYATLLDWYIQACLFFNLAAIVETVVAFYVFYAVPPPASYTTAPADARGATASAYADAPSLKLHTDFDVCAWLALAALWALTNLFFVVQFTHNYAQYHQLQVRQRERLERRRDLMQGLHPMRRAPARAAGAAGAAGVRGMGEEGGAPARLTLAQSLGVARGRCCRRGAAGGACLRTLARTLRILAVNVRDLLLYTLLALDALLLCRAGGHFVERWRRAEAHTLELHQRSLRQQGGGGGGAPPPYQPHEFQRMYAVSTRKNRMA